jgi:hypothetical protein
MGVWAVCLVFKGGFMAPPPDRDDDLHANRRKKKDVDTLNSAAERLAISSTQEQYISPSSKVALRLISMSRTGRPRIGHQMEMKKIIHNALQTRSKVNEATIRLHHRDGGSQTLSQCAEGAISCSELGTSRQGRSSDIDCYCSLIIIG